MCQRPYGSKPTPGGTVLTSSARAAPAHLGLGERSGFGGNSGSHRAGSTRWARRSVLLAVSRQHPDLAWNFALQHVDQPSLPLNSSNRLTLMPEIASSSGTQKRAEDLPAYASEHIPSNARQNVMAAIATINLNAKFRAERLPEIDGWLSGKTTP